MMLNFYHCKGIFHRSSVVQKVLPSNVITMIHSNSLYNTQFARYCMWISIRYEWTFLLPVILPHIEHNLSISLLCDLSWHQLTIVSAFVLCIWQYGYYFTNDIGFIIHVLRKICFAIFLPLEMGLLQIFAHAITAVVSWHVQNYVVIDSLGFGW